MTPIDERRKEAELFMLCTVEPPADEPLLMNIFPVTVKAFIMKSISLKFI